MTRNWGIFHRPTWMASGLIVILLGAGLAYWDWRSEPKRPPDPQTASPATVVQFLGSTTLAQMRPRERYEYIYRLLATHLAPQDRQEITAQIARLSDAQIRLVCNNMVDGLKTRFLIEAREYQTLGSTSLKQRYIDAKLAECDTFRVWVADLQGNDRIRKSIPIGNWQGVFNLLMERTTPTERSALEGYLSNSLRRYLELQAGKNLAAGRALLGN